MDVGTRIRLLLGPVRPFALGKMRAVFTRKRARNILGSDWQARLVADRALLNAGRFPVECAPPVDKNKLLSIANDFVSGSMSVMDSVYMAPFLWHTHPAAHAEWDNEFWFTSIPTPGIYGTSKVKPDVRIPHEALRMHHWPLLALAAHLDPSNKLAYTNACKNDIVDFLDRYPACHGLAWAFPMGVGMRLQNLLIAWDWLQQAGCTDQAFDTKVSQHALYHAEFTRQTEEWSGGMRTSHYIGCLAGIHAAGVYLDHPQAKDWLQYGRKHLRNEFQVQFLQDGMNFEASTGYHIHVVDFFEVASVIDPDLRLDNTLLHKAVTARHNLMAFGIPKIGDNDDGMAILPTVRLQPRLLEHTVQADPMHMAYPDFGLDLYQRAYYQLTARCGGIGQWGKGGHAHNDRNSITVRVHTTDGWQWLIVDPGIKTYTGDPGSRNLARSTAVHATLSVPGKEQLSWPNDNGEGLFWMLPDTTRAEVLDRNDNSWIGKHDGFGWQHRREIGLSDASIEVTDHHKGGELVWPLGPNVTPRISRNTVQLYIDDQHVATLEILADSNEVVPEVYEGEWWPSYAMHEAILYIRYKVSGNRTRWILHVHLPAQQPVTSHA